MQVSFPSWWDHVTSHLVRLLPDNLSRKLVSAILTSSTCWLTATFMLLFSCWMLGWFWFIPLLSPLLNVDRCLSSLAFFWSLPKPAIFWFCRPEQRRHHRRGHHPCISDFRRERQAPLEDEGGDGQGSGRAGCAEADRGGSEERSPETGGDGLQTGPGSGETLMPLSTLLHRVLPF